MTNYDAGKCKGVMMKHPLQTVYMDEHGTNRFYENPLVSMLIDRFEYEGLYGLNGLGLYYQVNGIKEHHYEQITQLIGYSVEGFGMLSTTTDEVYYKAKNESDKLLEEIK
ncbi:hypothetical protein S14_61 [Shewanella sp. phage 1/4]|uniref:hypothetical protein n=1 Tax=Shewanella phage 1/4 TaxID=1458859 RepID=UPI0004F78D3A|nr:hypothetical protein S14_61 [Shewanella sp. phage 1/4]AHK11173.1 hypothetical protein S14_61 [Shewanella sp. phage 1/4]